MNIHIFGASRAGKTTLAKAVADELGLRHTDTDEAYFIPTDPPFQQVRPVEERLAFLREILETPPGTVFGGALSGWGHPLTPLLSGVVWLDTPTPLRLQRLERRERERYGHAVLPGGLHDGESRAFVAWAAAYDAGTADGRSRERDTAWIRALPCPSLHLGGTRPVADLVADVVAWVKHMQEPSLQRATPSAFKLRPVSVADRAFVEEAYFTTQRWLIEELFGWLGDDIERAKFAEFYDQQHTSIISAGSQDVGWATVLHEVDHIELEHMYLSPEAQGRGIGTGIVQGLIVEAKASGRKIRLSTARINPARRLYERLGFEIVGENEFKVHMEWRANAPCSTTSDPSTDVE